jgi:hypothetical protein
MLFASEPPLFVHGFLPAVLAVLLELNFPFNALLVLAGIVIPVATDRALEDDQIVRIFRFCHIRFCSSVRKS